MENRVGGKGRRYPTEGCGKQCRVDAGARMRVILSTMVKKADLGGTKISFWLGVDASRQAERSKKSATSPSRKE
jgi:hypothetical protein